MWLDVCPAMHMITTAEQHVAIRGHTLCCTEPRDQARFHQGHVEECVQEDGLSRGNTVITPDFVPGRLYAWRRVRVCTTVSSAIVAPKSIQHQFD